LLESTSFKTGLSVTKCLQTVIMSLPFQTVYSVDARLGNDQVSHKESTATKGKSLKCDMGREIQTVSCKEEQHLKSL
jgi:hypothetical protein